MVLAWVATLLISELPSILWRELTGAVPAWVFPVKVGLLLTLIALSFLWPAARSLRNYFIVFFGIYITSWAVANVTASQYFRSVFGRLAAPSR
jgi:hypothetical protein